MFKSGLIQKQPESKTNNAVHQVGGPAGDGSNGDDFVDGEFREV